MSLVAGERELARSVWPWRAFWSWRASWPRSVWLRCAPWLWRVSWPRFVWSWSASPARSPGGPGAPVAGGVALMVRNRDAPGGPGVADGPAGEFPGQGRIDRAESSGLPGAFGQAEQGRQRDGQVDRGGQGATRARAVSRCCARHSWAVIRPLVPDERVAFGRVIPGWVALGWALLRRLVGGRVVRRLVGGCVVRRLVGAARRGRYPRLGRPPGCRGWAGTWGGNRSRGPDRGTPARGACP